MAESISLEFKPTWVVAAVCFLIILISLLAERGLNYLGKCLKHHNQDTLFEALQKLKAELMLLGFISLLLNVFQGLISDICIPTHLESAMVPCKKHTKSESHEKYSPQAINNVRLLLSAEIGGSDHCSHQGKVPLLSTESFHQLHIFIFVVAVVHVISCATILVLGTARIRQWKPWEDWISKVDKGFAKVTHSQHLQQVLEKFAWGYWRRAAVISWIMSFSKQFYGSVTKSDYIALREGFIMTHVPAHEEFDFHKHMMQSLERDFRHVVGISWYQWLFVVVFLILNVEGWNTYFWLSILPTVLLLLVGAKLEHIIVRLVQDVDEMMKHPGLESASVRPSDEYFWFNRPRLVLDFIHFILFQNAFEIAFFFWILWTYGFHSCMMEGKGFIITRLVMGVIVQVLCSYITLPLYALVTMMGTTFNSEPAQGQSSPVTI
ncbi:MILDEW RESISTANCE LOCUS O 13 [Hibiscus trionum]|uniref:MLO-like protein n=1 Tax=Hibiscus trionum TaxID=183268 RepID=A0A9W7M8Y6_HIBTR|nr:MILDEW RESISTANCE LOCUS O 13 [Hibiscus trionum]